MRTFLLMLTVFAWGFVTLIPGHAQVTPDTQASQQQTQWKIAKVNGKKVARITNSEGHILDIYRADEKGVWFRLRFQLSPKSLDALGKRSPILRVDDKEAADFEEVARFGSKYLSIQSRSITLLIYGGVKGIDPKSLLGDIVSGRTLTIRYFLYGETSRDTDFPLTGAAPVIAEALGPL